VGDVVWLSLADTQDLDAGFVAQVTVLRPTGATLVTASNEGKSVTLPDTGTYAVRVWDNSYPYSHTRRGSYRLHLEWTWPLAKQCTVAGTLACGQTVDASIGESGEQDLYTFTGTVGDVVWLSLADTQDLDAGFVAQVTVLRPTGATLVTASSEGKSVTLPDTGTYAVRVWDNSYPYSHTRRGSYRLHLEWTWPTNRPCLAISPSSGIQGQTFDVWGSGYTPNSTVDRLVRLPDLTDVVLPPVTSDGTGRISWQSATTCATPTGPSELRARDQVTNQLSNTARQTVNQGNCPTLTVDGGTASTRLQGQAFTFAGTGYTANGAVTRWVRDPGGTATTLTPGQTATGSGAIGWTFVSSCTTAPGTYTVWAVDDATGRPSAPVNETVTVEPACRPLLTVSSAGTGSGTVTSEPAGITCGSDCSEAYPIGTVVMLTAGAAAGSTFGGWSGDADCHDGLVTLTTARNCTATFLLGSLTCQSASTLSWPVDTPSAWDHGGNPFANYLPSMGGHHPGEDWTLDSDDTAGQPVRAIAPGLVRRIFHMGGDRAFAIAVEHVGLFLVPARSETVASAGSSTQTYSYLREEPSRLFSVYLHLTDPSLLGLIENKSCVSAGQVLGTVARLPGGSSHLHFEIRHGNALNSPSYTLVRPESNWAPNGNAASPNGYYLSVQGMVDSGQRHPSDVIAANSIPGPVTRQLDLSGDLAFGDVAVGGAATRTLTIANAGNAPLTVSGISYPTAFSGEWSGTIEPGGSQAVTVTFAPTSVANYAGLVTVHSDRTGGQNTRPTAGRAIAAVPASLRVHYFAEGATGDLFDTRLALLNVGTEPALVALEFHRSNGAKQPHTITVGSLTRGTVFANQLPGMTNAEFSTVIESDQPLVADRTMTWDSQGYGAHAETSISAPALTWYLAEGATHSGFDLFYLLQNPNAAESHVRVRYLRPSGAPLEKTYTLPPTSRTNIWVDVEEFAGLGQALSRTDVSAVIEVLNGQPIIVERAMYLSSQGRLFNAGHESAGITAPASEWFLAEGATGPLFDLFVLIANPGTQDAEVEATYLLPDGTTIVKPYHVPATSRFNIWVDNEGGPLADTAVSTTVRSTNAVPIIVERAMWWPGDVSTWQEAHNSSGATTTGTRWALAEGEVDTTRGLETYILIANTSATLADVKVTLLFEDGPPAEQTYSGIPPRSRFNVPVGEFFPQAAKKRFGAIVESVGSTPAQIVVERAMYWDAAGQHWAAGTNALATRLQ
jgi:hypothetical protein